MLNMILKNLNKPVVVVHQETRAPSIYATEGAFRGLEEIKQYVSLRGNLSVEVQPKNELRRNKE